MWLKYSIIYKKFHILWESKTNFTKYNNNLRYFTQNVSRLAIPDHVC